MAKKTIGRFDTADFPELGLAGLKVKVDTGAYTSSLHATEIHERLYKGVMHLYFKALGSEHPKYKDVLFRFSDYTTKRVKSSSGESEVRYFVDTVISLFGEDHPVTISLTNRSTMRAPVLLGRRLISNRFVVDVNKANVSLKQKKDEGDT